MVMTLRAVVVVAVMVGMRQEGIDPDDDRSMMTTQTMITVVVRAMRAEVEDRMMSCASSRRGSVGLCEAEAGIGVILGPLGALWWGSCRGALP